MKMTRRIDASKGVLTSRNHHSIPLFSYQVVVWPQNVPRLTKTTWKYRQKCK